MTQEHMVVFEHGGIRRQLRRKVPSVSGTGFTFEGDGYEEGTVEVTVDLKAIAETLGRRAMWNKSGKAKFMQGAVVVRVKRRARVRSEWQD